MREDVRSFLSDNLLSISSCWYFTLQKQ